MRVYFVNFCSTLNTRIIRYQHNFVEPWPERCALNLPLSNETSSSPKFAHIRTKSVSPQTHVSGTLCGYYSALHYRCLKHLCRTLVPKFMPQPSGRILEKLHSKSQQNGIPKLHRSTATYCPLATALRNFGDLHSYSGYIRHATYCAGSTLLWWWNPSCPAIPRLVNRICGNTAIAVRTHSPTPFVLCKKDNWKSVWSHLLQLDSSDTASSCASWIWRLRHPRWRVAPLCEILAVPSQWESWMFPSESVDPSPIFLISHCSLLFHRTRRQLQ